MFADDHRVLTSGPFPDDDQPRASSLYYIFIFLKFSDLFTYLLLLLYGGLAVFGTIFINWASSVHLVPVKV